MNQARKAELVVETLMDSLGNFALGHEFQLSQDIRMI
jgi:hypothetical protein